MTEVTSLDDSLPIEELSLNIMRPGVGPTGWIVRLAGPSHPQTIELDNKIAKRNLAKSARIEQARINGKKFYSDEKTPEQARRETAEDVVARIIGWSPVSVEGNLYEFSPETAVELLLMPKMGWAYSQIINAITEDDRFTPGSAKP